MRLRYVGTHYSKLVLRELNVALQLVLTDPAQLFPAEQGTVIEKKRQLTGEQNQAVATTLKKTDVLKIRAFAGTGKTTTLVEYALARPSLKFLYLAFNVSVRQQVSRCHLCLVNGLYISKRKRIHFVTYTLCLPA